LRERLRTRSVGASKVVGQSTMDLTDLIRPESILPALKASSKKQVLQSLAEKAAAMTGREEREIFETLFQREKLGSTGIGGGIAIPHGKLAGLDRIFAMFARLAQPVDFEAPDEQPVDLVFLLLAPEGAGADHLKALARIARILREPGIVDKLRASSDRSALGAVLADGTKSDAA
jgi:PTS system nitrogen regulatory IIA component